MMKRALIALMIISSLARPIVSWWPFSSSPAEDPAPAPANAGAKSPLVPFEMRSVEEKFLLESQHLMTLSSLDRCQLQVVGELKKSCGEVSEEELAKLSVLLLNCQSEAEGRQVFPCTERMTVAECTRPMDPHMWNAYHIISNRARSVCFAIRQQQFRRQTEAAVNTLSRSTMQQLHSMQELALAQDTVRNLTQDSIDGLRREQEGMMKRQGELSGAQKELQDSIDENLDRLSREKSLIYRSQQQLANMTESIQQQLDLASSMLVEQEKDRLESQGKVNEDLQMLRKNIQEVWLRIDSSTEELFQLLGEMNHQYQGTVDNLRTINATVMHVLGLLDSMNSAVNIQLNWLTERLGGAQAGLQRLLLLASHALFLLLASLGLLFVRAPWLSRLSLLLLVVGNIMAELWVGACLSLSLLAGLLVTTLIANWLSLWFIQLKSRRIVFPHVHGTESKKPLPIDPPILFPPTNQSTPTRDHSPAPTMDLSDKDELQDLYEDLATNGGYQPVIDTMTTPPDSFLRRRDITSTPVSASGRCIARTRTGLPCRLQAQIDSAFCHRHNGF